LCRASEFALHRGADTEAVLHARDGLQAVAGLDDGQLRDELTLGLLTVLAEALRHTQGYSVPEVIGAYRDALDLSRRLGRAEESFRILRGMHSYYLLRGPLSLAHEFAIQLLDHAKHTSDQAKLSEARRCLGWTAFCRGELQRGRELVARALSQDDVGASARWMPHEPSPITAVTLANLAWMSWFSGETDEAVGLSRQAIADARVAERPFTLAYTLCMAGAVQQSLGVPDAVEMLVEEATAIASRHDFQYWLAWGKSLLGWAGCMRGDAVQGMADMESGLRAYTRTGAFLFVPHVQCMMAEAMLKRGEHARAKMLTEQSLQVEHERQVRFLAAESRRLKGVALWRLGEHVAAEKLLTQAIEVARQQGARALEHRAADCLARLSVGPGEHQDEHLKTLRVFPRMNCK
jgi:tetratricopeptide (TPR) repeat protein